MITIVLFLISCGRHPSQLVAHFLSEPRFAVQSLRPHDSVFFSAQQTGFDNTVHQRLGRSSHQRHGRLCCLKGRLFCSKHSSPRSLLTSAARPLVWIISTSAALPLFFRAQARQRQSNFVHLLQQLVLHRCLAKCSDERGVQGLKDQAWCREVRHLNGHVLNPPPCPSGTAALFCPSIL